MIDESALYVQIGNLLKSIRTNPAGRQLTQAKLADLVGLERTSITNIESGKQRVPLHVLYELCNALGVEISEVLPRYKSVSQSLQQEEILIGDTSVTIPKKLADLIRNS